MLRDFLYRSQRNTRQPCPIIIFDIVAVANDVMKALIKWLTLLPEISSFSLPMIDLVDQDDLRDLEDDFQDDIEDGIENGIEDEFENEFEDAFDEWEVDIFFRFYYFELVPHGAWEQWTPTCELRPILESKKIASRISGRRKRMGKPHSR